MISLANVLDQLSLLGLHVTLREAKPSSPLQRGELVLVPGRGLGTWMRGTVAFVLQPATGLSPTLVILWKNWNCHLFPCGGDFWGFFYLLLFNLSFCFIQQSLILYSSLTLLFFLLSASSLLLLFPEMSHQRWAAIAVLATVPSLLLAVWYCRSCMNANLPLWI